MTTTDYNEQQQRTIRVAIVEDDPSFLDALNRVVQAAPDMYLSGRASSQAEGLLDYITKGFTAQEIAKLMDLSHFTVRSFVRRIYSKLKVKSKSEAIYEARVQGLLPD
jgi:DNA-binding NarL/FixJ family response regulator